MISDRLPRFFSLRRLNLKWWAVAQLPKVSYQLLFSLPNIEGDGVREFLKSVQRIRSILGQEAGLVENSERRVDLLKVSAWYGGMMVIPVLTLFPKLYLRNIPEEEITETIAGIRSELEVYHAAKQELGTTRRKKRHWVARLEQSEENARNALYQMNLAGAYLSLSRGDPSRSLELAIEQYETGLRMVESEKLPEVAAIISTQMAGVLLSYPSEHAERYAPVAIETLLKARQALAPYIPGMESFVAALDALQVRKSKSKALAGGLKTVRLLAPKAMAALWRGVPGNLLPDLLGPDTFATVDWGLGTAYRNLGEVEKAVGHFDVALRLLPKAEFERQRALIQISKGLAYFEATSGNRMRNLTEAFKWIRQSFEECNGQADDVYAVALSRAVEVCLDPEAMAVVKPQQRAADNAMLVSYILRAIGLSKTHGLHAVRQHALFLAGRIFTASGDLPRAFRFLLAASRSAEQLYSTARTTRLKRHFAGTGARLYDILVRIAYKCQSMAPSRKERGRLVRSALSHAELARTRFLQEQIAARDLLPLAATAQELDEFFKLRRLWQQSDLACIEHEASPDHGWNDSVTKMVRARRRKLEQTYFSELERVRERFGDSRYDPDRPIHPIGCSEIAAMVDELSITQKTALVEYFITDTSLMVFVVLPSSRQISSRIGFHDLGISCGELKELEGLWAKRHTVSLVHWERGYLPQVLNRLKRAVEKPVGTIQEWEQRNKVRIDRVIVVPHRLLHVIPLHAVPLPSGTPWGDAIQIQYAPSASVLWRMMKSDRGGSAKRVSSSAGSRKTVSVSYAKDGSLPFSKHEARAVAKATDGELFEDQNATPRQVVAAMKNASYIHFACHGRFDEKEPLQSALELAPDPQQRSNGQETTSWSNGDLTLGEIFESVQLEKAPLVVLNACETGMVKREEFRDEYIGLPAGFLYAGASTVVSTLWKIPDIGTWFLNQSMVRFLTDGIPAATSMRLAQQEFRTLHINQVVEEVHRMAAGEEDNVRRMQMMRECDGLVEFGSRPFASPAWWAGFAVNGFG